MNEQAFRDTMTTKKKSCKVKLSNWLSILLIVQSSAQTQVIKCDHTTKQQQQPQQPKQPQTTSIKTFNSQDNSVRNNPIILNTNTLYDHNLASGGIEKFYNFNVKRFKRSNNEPQTMLPSSIGNFVDACQSKLEVITPFYATNSKGKLRTVVNSELMQQAIQIETCSRSPSANKCNAQHDCGCEQKYKWHRLLVLDASKDATSSNQKSLFMDWFLFPSSCVCRCRTQPNSARQFLKTIQQPKQAHLVRS